jgi:hypothetical protein
MFARWTWEGGRTVPNGEMPPSLETKVENKATAHDERCGPKGHRTVGLGTDQDKHMNRTERFVKGSDSLSRDVHGGQQIHDQA